MIRKRRQLLLLALSTIAIIGVGYGLYALTTPQAFQPGHAKDKYNRLQKGMTEAETHGIMTVPPGEYASWPYETPFCGTGLPREDFRKEENDELIRHQSWTWDDGIVSVRLDTDDIIVGKSYTPVWPQKPFLSRMFDRLRRPFGD